MESWRRWARISLNASGSHDSTFGLTVTQNLRSAKNRSLWAYPTCSFRIGCKTPLATVSGRRPAKLSVGPFRCTLPLIRSFSGNRDRPSRRPKQELKIEDHRSRIELRVPYQQ